MNARERVVFEAQLDEQLAGIKSDLMVQIPDLWDRCLSAEDPLQEVKVILTIVPREVQAMARAPHTSQRVSSRKIVAPSFEDDET